MEHAATLHFTDREPDHGGGTKEIWRTFWILLILTVVELGLGYWNIGVPDGSLKITIKITIIALMLLKAFYIVAYFMHLKSEVKNLMLTIIIPLLFLVWGIGAFLMDGNSYRNLRNTHDRHYKEASETKAPKTEEHEKKHGALE